MRLSLAQLQPACMCVCVFTRVLMCVIERDLEIPGIVDTCVCLAPGIQTVSARAV